MSLWQTMVASAIGAGASFAAIYVFGFRQIIAAKDAQIELLKQQMNHLEKDRAPTLIQEKQHLVSELEAQAKRNQEWDEKASELVKKLQDEVQKVQHQTHQQLTQIGASVATMPDLVKAHTSRATTVGLLRGAKSLVQVASRWRGVDMAGRDPALAGFDRYLQNELIGLIEVISKVHAGATISPTDFQISQDDLNQIRLQQA